MRAFWTRPAQADLAAVDAWYSDSNSAFADRVGRAAILSGEFLGEHPEAGEVVKDDVRRWHVPRTPYILLYRTALGRVEILRVRHGRENWQSAPL